MNFPLTIDGDVQACYYPHRIYFFDGYFVFIRFVEKRELQAVEIFKRSY
jgi:hypothetical protein